MLYSAVLTTLFWSACVVADPFDPIGSPGTSVFRLGSIELGTPKGRITEIRGESDGDLILSGSPITRVDPATGVIEFMDVAWDRNKSYESFRGTSWIGWLRDYEDSSSNLVRVTDFRSGEILREFTLESVLGLNTSGLGVLDEKGLVLVGRNRIITTDVLGNHSVETPFDAGTPFDQVKLKALADSIVLRRPDPITNQRKFEWYDRATLKQYSTKTLHNNFGHFDAAGGRLVVASTVNFELYDLPEFTRTGKFTTKEFGLDRVEEVHLANQTLWLLGWSEIEGDRVLALDIRSGTPVLRASFDGSKRLSSYGDGMVLATDRYFVQSAYSDRELVVYRLPSEKTAWIEMGDAPLEGSPVKGRVRLATAQQAPVVFQVSAHSGVAIEGEDFPSWSESITIAAGSLDAEFEVPTLVDSVLEPHEIFCLRLATSSDFELPKPTADALILGTGPSIDLYTSQENSAAWGVSAKNGWTSFLYADDEYFLGTRGGKQLWALRDLEWVEAI